MATTTYMAAAPITRRVRAYFAPVNRAAQTPVLFDPSELGGFTLNTPPAPWIALGWIKEFARKPVSKIAAVMTGIPSAALEQVRETVDAEVSFHFLSWTKLTMALATGSQHMNLLVPMATGAISRPDGATAVTAVVVAAGSSATYVALAPADAAKFTAGQMIAVDVDYTGQLGYVGSPVSGAYVKTALTDVDYIRRVTFNVARIASVATTGAPGLTLAEALPGGAPVAGNKLQAFTGFVDREGGSFFQEWSALFVMEGTQGERIFFHYPRLQAIAGAMEAGQALDSKGTLERVLLTGQYRALPVTDPMDGERVVCYRSFVPAVGALV